MLWRKSIATGGAGGLIAHVDDADFGEPKPKRVFGLQPEAFLHVAPDFEAPVRDETWGFEEKK